MWRALEYGDPCVAAAQGRGGETAEIPRRSPTAKLHALLSLATLFLRSAASPGQRTGRTSLRTERCMVLRGKRNTARIGVTVPREERRAGRGISARCIQLIRPLHHPDVLAWRFLVLAVNLRSHDFEACQELVLHESRAVVCREPRPTRFPRCADCQSSVLVLPTFMGQEAVL
jgi:hypothetical protein